MELVRRGRGRTRRELRDRTGLSRSVVAQTVSDLIDQGLIVERGARAAATSRGRPSTTLRLAPRSGYVAGLDLGHRHIAVALGDLHERLLDQRRIAFPVDSGAEPALRRARALLTDVLRGARTSWAELRAVAVALPFAVVAGKVTPPGRVPSWDGASPELLLRLPAPTALVVGNDANTGAWGELVSADDPGGGTVLYAKAGDGIGAGLVVNGALVGGAHGAGGEIGHVLVPECTLRCRCGRTGCLDALVTAAGSPGACLAEQRSAGTAVGRLLAQLGGLVDPDLVVLGGELGVRDGAFATAARAAYTQHAALTATTLSRPRLGLDAEVRGALDLATEAAWAQFCPGTGRIFAVS